MPPAAPHPLVLRGREALQRGDMRAVEAAADERLKMAGRDVNALELRFIVQQRRGQHGQAARTLEAVIGIDQRADWAYNELIQLYLAHGKRDEAETVARAALRANPRNAQAHNLFGALLTQMKQFPPGESHLRAALELGGPQASVLTNLADNLKKQHRLQEAQSCLAQARELAPECADTVPPATPAQEHFAKGRVHEATGNYSAAWEEFLSAKGELLKESPGAEYRASAVQSVFERCKQFFTRESVSLLPLARQRPETPQPLFLMGFPRSGASLAERVLRQHPAIAAGGELPFAGDLGKLASHTYPGAERFPDCLAHGCTADYRYTATLFRDYYLARAEQYGLLKDGRRYFTDTMPFNEIYLPLIKMAFPAAKIVRVVRHPLDVCVSMMSSHINNNLHCGYRVEDVAHYLAAAFDLLEHYRRVLDLNDFVLRYEALVGEQASETTRLLDYLGLPREEACLRYEVKVRSVSRYRHYEQHLRPYLLRLQPLMNAYGYKP